MAGLSDWAALDILCTSAGISPGRMLRILGADSVGVVVAVAVVGAAGAGIAGPDPLLDPFFDAGMARTAVCTTPVATIGGTRAWPWDEKPSLLVTQLPGDR
jgi:hypothetical protein